jgi:2-polyprenyl-3-methyl-5-hydroxy-6-metoxy-1,4-benzoquinol methylase
MDRSLHGLAGAAEWPSLRSLLPDLRGARILDLGCGFGWFSRWAREQGAQSVLGFDVSENMLKRAIEMTSDDAIVYRKFDLEQTELPEAGFDLVFSSLALHYVENLGRVFRSVFRALVPGGWLIFSTEHPIYTAPRRPNWLIQNDGHRILADRPISGRGFSSDGLADQGGHQTASDDRDDCQFARSFGFCAYPFG